MMLAGLVPSNDNDESAKIPTRYVYNLTCITQNFYCIILFTVNLDEEDVEHLKPVCKDLDIPLQLPVEVIVQAKMIKEDVNTHRVVEFRNESTYVALNSIPEFGQLKMLFTYRDNKFAFLAKYDSWNMEDGLIHIKDTTTTTRVAAHLDSLSSPLVTAAPQTKELWILNHHT